MICCALQLSAQLVDVAIRYVVMHSGLYCIIFSHTGLQTCLFHLLTEKLMSVSLLLL